MAKLTVFAFLFSVLTFAGEQIDLNVFGRTFVHSCGYFSTEAGDFQVVAKSHGSHTTPWGTKMTLIYGWRGYKAGFGGNNDQTFNWAYKNEVEMKAVAAYIWRADLEQTLHERTSPQSLTDLQFVVRVEVPGAAPRFLNGGTAWGYFQARAREFGQSACINSELDKPNFRLIPHTIVDQN